MINVGTQNLRTTSLSPTYDVIPGEGVGIFQLGDNLWHVLELLRTHKTEYPKVEVSWDEDSPHKSAVTIHLPYLALYFPPSPIHQLLSLIQITIPPSSNLELTYETQVLSSSHMPLTRARVGRLMGPTFISKAGDKLDFPGISFQLNPTNMGDAGFGPREDIVHKIIIEPKEDEELQPRLISCVIEPNKGITLGLDEDHTLPIIIGETTAQDLILDIGSPLRKFWKEDDRLSKMWGGKPNDQGAGACFWNYFQYGLDFLVDKDGIVIKILCHSNIPGTPSFQRYAKCPWVIPTSSGQLDSTSTLNSFRSHFSSTKSSEEYIEEIRLTVPSPSPPSDNINNAGTSGSGSASASGGKKKKKRNGSPNSAAVSASENEVATQNDEPNPQDNSKSSAIKSTSSNSISGTSTKKNEVQGDAMILDRLVEGGLDGVSGLGTSKLVGFDGLIIEEDEKSGGICSVLIYKDNNHYH
ncbi:uncharacterized protein I303_104610 [Kwoniella dejecticola CBS 10117]|uniref:Uncharacterized protein n=1 Tax=Kwoniella dejecticola CBS 10117 TaxID=1296121 RepID=A0A1A6A4U7_9TREE|nr:uncharacterized protein I303_04412 [Kwoniella dejecticola CBS 10117]OBR85081.1 hypothetical protein I303_04412 [Kwoniella dejecticola CBS 10117]